ncbi:GntR family transcriptional regulator [Corynebacterium comes]|uniref:Transcriptional regulator NanR n=1 Tax=Corynebacterium comes TaxID=2675218 RepID=A0A6B8VJ72_9CORY|nr:GntR family transcriptional regulator [Corynebacterium comes]QGU04143.1 transcriptional regulator NanR [Corynebacterium comes]
MTGDRTSFDVGYQQDAEGRSAGARQEGQFRESLRKLLLRNLGFSDREESLVAQIAGDVGLRIIEGELLPGDEVNSVDLAKQFGTSRTPVREALLMLEKHRMVEVPARRRPRVSDFLEVPVKDLYHARALVTGFMAEAVCRNWQGTDLEPMRAKVAQMAAACDAGDVNAFFWANISFGECATSIAGNSLVAGFIDSIGLSSLRLRRKSMTLPGRMEESTRDHQRLMLAFERRDSQLAKALSMGIIRDAYLALTNDNPANWHFT